MKTLSFKQQDDNFEINGVCLTREELDLFLGTHGFYVTAEASVPYYFKSLASLSQLSEDELHTSLEYFSKLSATDKHRLQEEVSKKRRISQNLTETSNFYLPT